VYFGRKPSFDGRYVSLDSNGYRVTPQPTTPAVPAARVLFLGGSTMWGDFQRDSGTIAAVTARRLQTLAGPGQRIEVTNLGESGYVSTQEVIKLLLELRAGRRPDVVVFFDGINDVASTVQAGAPGLPQNESKRVAEFEMGRTIDPLTQPRGLKKELRALALLTKHALRQTAMVQWAREIGSGVNPAAISADSAARGTAHTYVENVRLVEALAAQYGFTPVYVWQPNLHTTNKVPQPFEKNLLGRLERDPFNRLIRDDRDPRPAITQAGGIGTQEDRNRIQRNHRHDQGSGKPAQIAEANARRGGR
jgi:lysophospholipase L1-like esterase